MLIETREILVKSLKYNYDENGIWFHEFWGDTPGLGIHVFQDKTVSGCAISWDLKDDTKSSSRMIHVVAKAIPHVCFLPSSGHLMRNCIMYNINFYNHKKTVNENFPKCHLSSNILIFAYLLFFIYSASTNCVTKQCI